MGTAARVVSMVVGLGAGLGLAAAPAGAAPTYKLAGSLPVTGGAHVSALAVDPATHTVHAAFGGRTVTPFPAGATSAGPALTVSSAANAVITGLDVDPGDGTLGALTFIYGGGLSTDVSLLSRFKAGSKVAESTVSPYPIAAAPDPVTHHTTVLSSARYVGSRNELAEVRGSLVVRATPLGFDPSAPVGRDVVAGDVAVDPATRETFVLDPAHDAVVVLLDGVITRRIAVADAPTRIAVDAVTHTAYVTHATRDVVSVLRSGAVLARVAVGREPVAVAVDPSAGLAFVANRFDGSVSVLRGGAVVSTTLAGVQHPTHLAVDASSHAVHVAGDRDDLILGGPARAAIAVLRPSEAPGIAYAGPGAGAAVPASSPVYAVFDHPMDRAATGAALRLVQGGGTTPATVVRTTVAWLTDSVAILVPEAPLAAGVTYTASAGAGARDADGRALATPVSWTFLTGSSFVDRAGPADGETGVARDVALWEVFTKPVALRDRAGMEAGFTLSAPDGTPVAGRSVWFGNQVLLFLPDAPLAAGTRYEALQDNGPDTTHLDAPSRRRFMTR